MILVTGGAGYIGSHTCLELLSIGASVLVLDNLSNSSTESLKRVQKIAGKKLVFVEGDVRDRSVLFSIFQKYPVKSVLHFAGLKAVGESIVKPLAYFEANVSGTLTLLQVMSEFECYNIVFSSSATVYGNPQSVPITEKAALSSVNPYGRSKLIVENILKDLALSNDNWSIAILRYFNPVGAFESGDIGEDPSGVPNNLMPYISQVAVGTREYLNVYGNDYPTPDGTGVRDYIHVVDLAKGHLKALDYIATNAGIQAFNLGTGRGYSVLEVLNEFEKASGKKVAYQITSRRPGDVAISYADPGAAKRLLGWEAEYGLDRMCIDAWRWQNLNPNGYRG